MHQTFLILLAALLLTGCPQTPPQQNDLSDTPATESPTPLATQADLALEGRHLFERTYEKLPEVKAKLHCASCHLQGGTAAGAAPLVNLDTYYPEQKALMERVNVCVQNNLNGPVLSAESLEMQALLVYLQGLRQEPSPPRGLKEMAMPSQEPSAERGEKLFAAQCAACHQADGSGSYPDGKYQYPALWGEHSFTGGSELNRSATLAGFLFVKMPLGQGMTLTEQEVWDIAAYVASQPRPKAPGTAE